MREGGFGFPNEFISPKEKEKDWYGLQHAKAQYYANNRYGSRFWYDSDEQYQLFTELAQGRQSTDDIRKLMGHFKRSNSAGDDGYSSFSYFDPKVLNIAPKYINRAVAKMQRNLYDISFDAIDLNSINQKKNQITIVKAFYKCKDFLENMSVDPQAFFPDVDISSLPKFPDEYLYDLNVNPKIKVEIASELAMKLLHSINDFQQVMRDVAWNLVVYGSGHIHCFRDNNGVPRVESILPKYNGGSYIESENANDQEYSHFFDFITVNQLRKEMLTDGYDEDEVQSIANQYSFTSAGYRTVHSAGDYQAEDGLDYIPVMRFYFKSEDNRKYVKMKNQYGTPMLIEKSFNYKPDETVKTYFDRGERELISNTYTSIYGGTWIIDSEIVYQYELKPYPRTNLVNATTPIKSFYPNYKEGRTVSFLAQMIEPLSMLNVAWNKIKEILAKGWMGVREIDFNQLEAVAMGHGGQVWSPAQVYDHFLKTNTLIKRGVLNKYDQNTGPGVIDSPSGLQLADYFTMFTTALNMLENMTGQSIVESMNVPDRLPAAGAKISQMTADIDMDYLYNAYEKLFQQASHQMMLMLQESKREGKKIDGFIPALGGINLGYFDVPDDLAYSELGMVMNRQPTDEQWADFYNDVRLALEKEQISIADSVYLREIDNLKQARQMMAIRYQQYKREIREDQRAQHEMNMEANTNAANVKIEGDIAKEKAKGEIQREVAILQGKIQESIQREKAQLDAISQGVALQVEERIAKQHGIDEIVKQAVRNIPEKAKAYAAQTSAQASQILANKPVPTSKPSSGKK